ncbi:polyamine aminopropyltransferase [Beggiatoa leptomitoformis]|uniref:Polyamine aminopropyltransferase n=1 Tax=Beggiatoa leptomitoformis TaxID=288004 RepID=A0A2N9YBG2_9GAMM|nr:polyamine aminopropyltransferase [Beggiatoa leptomitoformis]ALG66829.1 polyamine aminopropyltransferase [Beggiatoa leptomitoformis]AUI67818.1 polyamine aminopropyltransferase [Beggiatoa leptomitoformis]
MSVDITHDFYNGWYLERSRGWALGLALENKLFEKQSAYQKITVYQTQTFGKLLLLDDIIMVTERDEFIYHEMMAHVPLNVHPNPERVLVIGGGDGGTIREIVKHPTVKEAVLVEIDIDVINTAREYFPTIGSEFDNPRVKVLAEDGVAYIRNNQNYFDVIMIDSSDPIGFAEGLFQADFYRDVYNALKPDGIMTNQTDSPLLSPMIVEKTYSEMQKVFQHLFMYQGYCLTYPGGYWTFGFASKRYHPLNDFDPKHAQAKGLKTKHYNTKLHNGAFYLPNFALATLPAGCEQKNWSE